MDASDGESERAGPLPILAILGSTAAGKTALGLALARRLGGEIVSCDSQQVYAGMDIGTGKATAAERAQVPHHLLDVVRPDQPFSAARWAVLATEAIRSIAARGRLPIVVGGTGLYYRALVRGLFEAPPADPAIRHRHREEAASVGVPAMHRRLVAIDPAAAAAIQPADLVRISRALEIWEQTGITITELRAQTAPAWPLDAFAVWLAPPTPELRSRIEARVDAMMAAGFLDEVQRLRAAGYGGTRALASLGYAQLARHLDGAVALEDAVADTKRATVAFARRQRTWFARERIDLRIEATPDAEEIARAFGTWVAAR